MKVLHAYCQILGIQPDMSQDRSELVELIIQSLGEKCTEFDRQLLTLEEVPDHSMSAKWLQGNRTAAWILAQYEATLRYTPHFVANLSRDKGNAAARITNLLNEGKTGTEIARTLRDEGYSFAETTQRLQRMKFVVAEATYATDQLNQNTMPQLRVSKQPSAKGVQFWLPETADLTMGDPVVWTLDADQVQAYGLPVIVVRILQGQVI